MIIFKHKNLYVVLVLLLPVLFLQSQQLNRNSNTSCDTIDAIQVIDQYVYLNGSLKDSIEIIYRHVDDKFDLNESDCSIRALDLSSSLNDKYMDFIKLKKFHRQKEANIKSSRGNNRNCNSIQNYYEDLISLYSQQNNKTEKLLNEIKYLYTELKIVFGRPQFSKKQEYFGDPKSSDEKMNQIYLIGDKSYYDLVTISNGFENMSIHCLDENDVPYSNLSKLHRKLNSDGNNVKFMMNAGMYLPNRKPKGLYIEEYNQHKSIDTLKSDPDRFLNFYIQPNGIFAVDKNNRPLIKTTENFYRNIKNEDIRLATQSGPMLLVEGKINKELNPNSSSRYIRNGVGITKTGDLHFVITKKRVTFYEFAKVFEILKCTEALYLDGAISDMYFSKMRKPINTAVGPVIVYSNQN